MVTFGVYLNGIGTPWAEFRDEWRQAERLGFDVGWTMDNVVGPVHGHPELPTWEAYTLLAAVAASTDRIRLGTLITPCNRRHPAVLAKMASTVDHVSDGRLTVGMGPGDHEQYFRPWGMAFDAPSARIARLVEELEVMTKLWTEPMCTYEGEYYRLEEAVLEPKPVQDPHPPICIGLNFGTRLMPKVAARYADQVNVYIADDARARHLVDRVAEECDAIGRAVEEIEFSRVVQVFVRDRVEDPALVVEQHLAAMADIGLDAAELVRSDHTYDVHCVGPPAQVAEDLLHQVALGFDHLVCMIEEDESEPPADAMARVAEGVLPLVRAETA